MDVKNKIPEILLNGESLIPLIRKCTKITIIKELDCIDVVELELHGKVEIKEDIGTKFVYIEQDGKKYRLLEIIKDSDPFR